MQIYETVLILKSALSDPEVAEFVEKTKASVTADGGEILNNEVWGRRKLTHIIGKAREGVYAWLKYRAQSALVRKLEQNLRINEKVLRSMTVLNQDRKLREKPKKAKAKVPAAAAATQE